MRAADALQTVHPDTTAIQGRMQFLRRQDLLRDTTRQPQVDAEKARDSNEQNCGAEHRADTRN